MSRVERESTVAAPSLPGLPLLLIAALASLVLVPPVQGHARLTWTFLGVCAFLLGWFALLWLRARRTGKALRSERIVPLKAHYVQACVQLSIYTYWGLYWPKVPDAVPLIVAQILYFYVLDALLKWSRGRTWQLGLGPLPIVFSTNLFMWFTEDWFVFQFVMLTASALAKEFLQWDRDGRRRHIFNPAAFGLALAALVLMATDTHHLTYGLEVAKTLALPPYIYLWIFLLGLVVQYFFAVTLMTLSAGLALLLLNVVYTGVTGVYQFTDTNIPIAVFLGIHLLVTDPATSPRSNVGRVLFGGLYGATIFGLYSVLLWMDQPEFYDKLLAVPLLNLAVPALERLSLRGPLARLEVWQTRLRPRRLNHAAMALWTLICGGMLASGFIQAPHPGGSIAFWKQALDEDKPDAGKKLYKMIGSLAFSGNAAACNKLGEIYCEGRLTGRDEELAAFYFARACELGDLRGAANVARQFLFLDRAESEAVVALALDRLEQLAVAERDIVCAHLVGYAYETGKGRRRDAERAFELYRMAAALGCVDSGKGLIRVALRSGRAQEIRPADVQALSRGCEEQDPQSCLYLAYLQHALGQSEQRAATLLRRASTLGSVHAREVSSDPEWWNRLPPPEAPDSTRVIPLPFPRATQRDAG